MNFEIAYESIDFSAADIEIVYVSFEVADGNIDFSGTNIEVPDRSFKVADGNFENKVGKFGNGLANFVFVGAYSSFVALNCRSDICLYCGLVAPYTDFTYFFTSDAVRTIPVSGL